MVVEIISLGKGVSWCTDRQTTWVLAGGELVALTGVDQAIWGWLTLSYSIEMVSELLEKVLADKPVNAREQVERAVEHWLAQGILAVDEN